MPTTLPPGNDPPATGPPTRAARRRAHPAAGLASLAAADPMVAGIVERVTSVVGDHHGRVLLEYRLRQIGGDPSPASAVADKFGLGTVDVARIIRKARVALARAASEPGNEPLSRLAWIAA